MPDWDALVRDKLRSLDLPPKHRQEVIAELAAHLEDLYQEKLGQGISEREAEEEVVNEVSWPSLAKRIHRAKLKEEIMNDGTMNDRTRHFWLPGLVSLTSAMILLAIPIAISMQPRFLGRSPLEMVLLPWLLVLPLCGASGAYLSRRGGGNPRARLVAGLFPTIALLALGSILVVTRLLTFAHPEWWYGSVALAVGIIFPSVFLLIGAAPFLKPAKSR
jgi:hypothetical protein